MSSDFSLTHRALLSAGPSGLLADLYSLESAKIRQTFDSTGDGLAAVRERTRLVDGIVTQLYRDLLTSDASGPQNFSLVAVGGYGRRELFPPSVATHRNERKILRP